MTREETVRVLRTLSSSGFRVPEFTADFIEEWHRAMLGFDFTTAQEAAWGWMDNEDRWPTMNQWLGRLQAVARGQATERAALSLPPSPSDKRRAKAILATIAAVTADGRSGEALHQEVALRLSEVGISLPSAIEPLYACRGCKDEGMVRYDLEGQERYRPCPECNPDGALRWAEGHYESDHSCGACDALRGRVLRRRRAPAEADA